MTGNTGCLLVIWLFLAGVNSQDNLSKANNAFTVDLYKKIRDANNGKNLFFSPISISIAFGMISLGAKGNTKDQMKAVLHLDKLSSDITVGESYRQLLTTLSYTGSNYTLHMVNRLFGSKVFQFRKEFLQIMQNYFYASLESLDFIGEPDASRLHINQWVANKTNNKITDLLPSGTITSQTILVLANAIYLNALWVFPFDKTLTKPGPFRISNSKSIQTDMMHLNNNFLNYYDSSELSCEVLELPYKGDEASMFVFLPNTVDGLPDLENLLTADTIAGILPKLRNRNMNVQLPKFSIDQEISLKLFLQKLGMTDVFDSYKADLTGIVKGTHNLFVTDAIHKAIVNVSESGTEAAAATSIVVVGTSLQPPPIPFIVNRPVTFFILDKVTKTVLFAGRLVQPPTLK